MAVAMPCDPTRLTESNGLRLVLSMNINIYVVCLRCRFSVSDQKLVKAIYVTASSAAGEAVSHSYYAWNAPG